MYAALWRILPGPRGIKLLQMAVLAVVILSVAVEWVFPWVTATFIQPEISVEP
jgi:hypothetical protein